MATQLRLGIVACARGTTCSLRKAPRMDEVVGGEPCGKAIDHQAHLVTCSVGPGRMRPHRALQYALCRQLRAAGAEVDIERVVPELGGRAQRGQDRADAVLDLFVTFPSVSERFLVDVTIRSPHAARYNDAARGAHEWLGEPLPDLSLSLYLYRKIVPVS